MCLRSQGLVLYITDCYSELRGESEVVQDIQYLFADLSRRLEIDDPRHPLFETCSKTRAQPDFPIVLPAVRLEELGGAKFLHLSGARFPYMAGSMANGISSVDLVTALVKNGMMASFGAAGLEPEVVRGAIRRLKGHLGSAKFAVNFIHSPGEPGLEDRLTHVLMEEEIGLVEASAFLQLTPQIVRYRLAGLSRGSDGKVNARHKIIAKVSRPEIARHFLAPPPDEIISTLLAKGLISEAQAHLGSMVPMCDALTIEADSGGHTDNRPAISLFPDLQALAFEYEQRYSFPHGLALGLAGGIATPASALAAFSMGAHYVVTGTVNQACIEAGTSPLVRQYLSEADTADVAMAPAADMFEMGVKLQVLKRRTMFAMRAGRLYRLYQSYPSMEALPPAERDFVEKTLLRQSTEAAWESTKAYFAQRDPAQIVRAEQNPKHRMALVFRSYLGQSSIWANRGEAGREADYQIWCGPSMGAFNRWCAGMLPPESRRVAEVAMNILYGAALLRRWGDLRAQGFEFPRHGEIFRPMSLGTIRELAGSANQ